MADRVEVFGPQGQRALVPPKVARLLRGRGWSEGGGGVDYPFAPSSPPSVPQREEPLRVLAHVHKYPPIHNAGAEMMLHALLRYLVARGHECRVLAWETSHDLDGVQVHKITNKSVAEDHAWADIVVTHLDLTKEAVVAAGDTPVVHLVHNDKQLEFNEVDPTRTALVVFNSEWLAKEVNWSGRSIVLHPPVDPQEYRVEGGDAFTLINLSRAKGADTFYELARRLRGRKFIGVRGAYGRQSVTPGSKLKNVTVMAHQRDIRVVYKRTKVLLMPSSYESWGRVAIEAASSGIPTIAHPTPGLLESLGNAGIFVDRDDVDGWVEAIEALDDPATYLRASIGVTERANQLNPAGDLERWEGVLHDILDQHQRERGGRRGGGKRGGGEGAEGDRSGAVGLSGGDVGERVLLRERELRSAGDGYGTGPVQVGFLATQPQYLDHLAPIWHALNGERGAFVVPPTLTEHARKRGLTASLEADQSGPVIVASYADYRKANKMNPKRIIVLVEHGAGQNYGDPHAAYAGGADRGNVKLFLVPNQAAADRNAQVYPAAKIAVVGCPKLDSWAATPAPERSDPPAVAISFHWDCKLWPESRSAWTHYKRALPALVQAGYKVYGHAHPRMFDRVKEVYREAGIEPVRDFEDVLFRSDVYICDNSSTIFEFAATDRPVVVLNAPWYRRDVNHGLRFWDAAPVGIQVDEPGGLLDGVAQALLDSPQQRDDRTRAVALAYSAVDGRATARAVDAIRGVVL